MTARWIALALLLSAAPAQAQSTLEAKPAVVASGAYPEGLLWHGGQMYMTEMGADRVSIIEGGSSPREFWRDPGCGPTDIAPFGPSGFLVNCHIGKHVVEVSAKGVTGRRFRMGPNNVPIQDPNGSGGDGQGGVYFSDSGIFSVHAPATGRVYHLSAMGVMTEVVNGLRYTNGIQFDPATRTLYVSEHLARRILALTLDRGQRVTARRVFSDFAQFPGSRQHTYAEAGPDGLILGPGGVLIAAEYGEGRVHVFDRGGQLLNTLRVSMPFVDTVALDGSGNLYAGGSFQNTTPPFEGAVVRFSPNEWQRAPKD